MTRIEVYFFLLPAQFTRLLLPLELDYSHFTYMPPRLLSSDELHSVTIAFLRAKEMFQLWAQRKDELLEKFPELPNGRANDAILFQPASIYLTLGAALLYAVIEYFTVEGREQIPKSDCILPDVIKEDVYDLAPKLKSFRDCVFHVQPKPLARRQFALLEARDSINRIAAITKGIDGMLCRMNMDSTDTRPQDPPNQ